MEQNDKEKKSREKNKAALQKKKKTFAAKW